MNIAVLVDIGVVLVLLISAGVSFFRGFIREVLTLFGVFGGALAAFMFGGHLRPIMASWFGIEEGKDPGKIFDLIPKNIAADITAYATIFLLVFIVLQLISHFLSATVRALGLGPVDRTLGIFYGIARGVLLLGLLYLPFNLILSDSNKKEWLESSKTMFFVEQVSDWISSFYKQEGGKETVESTREKLKEIDVLGTKRLNSDEKKDAAKLTDPAKTEGYDDKARQGLEKLLNQNGSGGSPKEKPTTKGTYNE